MLNLAYFFVAFICDENWRFRILFLAQVSPGPTAPKPPFHTKTTSSPGLWWYLERGEHHVEPLGNEGRHQTVPLPVLNRNTVKFGVFRQHQYSIWKATYVYADCMLHTVSRVCIRLFYKNFKIIVSHFRSPAFQWRIWALYLKDLLSDQWSVVHCIAVWTPDIRKDLRDVLEI